MDVFLEPYNGKVSSLEGGVLNPQTIGGSHSHSDLEYSRAGGSRSPLASGGYWFQRTPETQWFSLPNHAAIKGAFKTSKARTIRGRPGARRTESTAFSLPA